MVLSRSDAERRRPLVRASRHEAGALLQTLNMAPDTAPRATNLLTPAVSVRSHCIGGGEAMRIAWYIRRVAIGAIIGAVIVTILGGMLMAAVSQADSVDPQVTKATLAIGGVLGGFIGLVTGLARRLVTRR